jgi:hypothetical protein
MKKKVKEIKKEACKYLDAANIVNGTSQFYVIEEEEMESAIKEIMDEIGYTPLE